jgi:hypothetical protein
LNKFFFEVGKTTERTTPTSIKNPQQLALSDTPKKYTTIQAKILSI